MCLKKIIFLLAISLLMLSCEDAIEVNLPQTESRLAVDGLIRVNPNQTFLEVRLQVSISTSFFDEIQPLSNLQNINISYGLLQNNTLVNPITVTLVETEQGIYTAPQGSEILTENINEQTYFQLHISHQNRQYFAQTKYMSSVPIDSLEEGTETLFDDDDREIIISFTDPEDIDNYYIFDFDFDNFLTVEDTFFKGQPFEFSYFYEDGLIAGDQIEISILGADKQFYDYMNLVLQQTEEGPGIFQPPAATIRGNIIDITDTETNPDNFALGYFAVVEAFSQTITIQ